MFIVPSTVATALRFPLGYRVGQVGPRPEKRLELYEFEGCPFCRKVREALTMLDLACLVKPTPNGGTRFRPEGNERGGKTQFPLLIDPNLSLTLYESDAIVRHLYANYGTGKVPFGFRTGLFGNAMSALASLARAGEGSRARPSRAPEQPLELWSFELSPYSRRVREVMSELELSYVLHNVGPGSAAREGLRERAGKVQVPYLEDPNTGKKMLESREIVKYLESTYAA